MEQNRQIKALIPSKATLISLCLTAQQVLAQAQEGEAAGERSGEAVTE